MRFRLGGDIAIILATKLVALETIKLLWFSDPPLPPTPEVATVLNAFDRLRKEHPARNPGAGLRQTCSDGTLV